MQTLHVLYHPQWSACLPLNPRLTGSGLNEYDGFLVVTKIYTTTSFRGEVRLLVPCRKILWHVEEPTGMKGDNS
jgi:hypothetical protein